jgi:hypothetical protein
MKQFGETVEGYKIPVLNEREIRASAGILFLFMFLAILMAILKTDFTMLKFMVLIFFIDMFIRVIVNPRFSPILIIGRFMVRKQTPIYVGAPQKKFAWIIGLLLSGTMVVLIAIMNTFSPISGIICLICLLFLFFETTFNVCIGCKLYGLFYKGKAQYCPGEICDIKDRQDIQKVSKTQFFIVLGFSVYIAVLIYFLGSYFSGMPTSLF